MIDLIVIDALEATADSIGTGMMIWGAGCC
jgi:hypothetical protein